MGGCLSLLAATLGTDFAPDFRDGILFWEDVDESLFRLDRLLTQLELGSNWRELEGVVAGVKGATLRRPDEAGWKQLLRDHLPQKGAVLAHHCSSCHVRPNLTLPLGVRVRLDPGSQRLEVIGL
jgi:muramoyltetrapeptide carboxypeptidase